MSYGVNAPFGLRPLMSINGGSWTEKLNTYYIACDTTGTLTYEVSIFTGDPVIWNPTIASPANGGGTIAAYPYNTDGTNAGNTTPILGVFMGCEYILPSGTVINTLGKSAYWPASTQVAPGSQIKAFVIDDPSVVYDVQVSTWTNTVTDAVFVEANFGGNWGVGLGGGAALPTPNPATGSALTGQSSVYLAKTFTVPPANQTLVTLPLKAIGWTLNAFNLSAASLTAIPPTQFTDYPGVNNQPYMNVRVLINNHTYKAGTLGVVAA